MCHFDQMVSKVKHFFIITHHTKFCANLIIAFYTTWIMIFHNLLVNAIGNYRYFNINMNVFSIHTCGINDTILTIIYSIVYTHVVKQIPL